MSVAVRQIILAGAVGILVVVLVVRLSRRGQLSFRYALGWIGVGSFGILASLFVPIAGPVARTLGLSAAALVGLGALIFITLISIQLSISISGLQSQVRVLAEEIGRLNSREAQSPSHVHAEEKQET